MDCLSLILKPFRLQAEVDFAGRLSSIREFDDQQGKRGYIHFVKSGSLDLIDHTNKKRNVGQPSVLVFADGKPHRIAPDPIKGVDLISASIYYKDVIANPLVSALPPFLKFQLSRFPDLKKTAKWIFREAFDIKSGRMPMIEGLCDVFIVQFLREVLDRNEVNQGMLAALAHPQLASVITEIHVQPDYPWSLESMADLAFMSRSKFADLFREVVGDTPGEYLTDWRMKVAQNALLKGYTVGVVAEKVGYENGSALARAFRKKIGVSPKLWQQQQVRSLPRAC